MIYDSPLVDIAISFVININPEINQENLNSIRKYFESYINKKITYEEASSFLKQFINKTIPMERLKSIMESEFQPVPLYKETDKCTSFLLRKKTRTWSSKEDDRLLFAIHKYGLDNWCKVSEFVGNGRTRSMCSQRWIRVLDPKISKNHWTKEEEKRLIQLVSLYGEKSWMKIANKLGNRSDVQCRYRYNQIVKMRNIQKQIKVPIFVNKLYPNSVSNNKTQNNYPQNSKYKFEDHVDFWKSESLFELSWIN